MGRRDYLPMPLARAQAVATVPRCDSASPMGRYTTSPPKVSSEDGETVLRDRGEDGHPPDVSAIGEEPIDACPCDRTTSTTRQDSFHLS